MISPFAKMLLLVFVCTRGIAHSAECSPGSDTCNFPGAESVSVDVNDKDLLVQSKLFVDRSNGDDNDDISDSLDDGAGDGPDGEDDAAQDAAKVAACAQMPELVDACYDPCVQAGEPEKCFKRCVHRQLQGEGSDQEISLLDMKKEMNLRSLSWIKSLSGTGLEKQVPTKQQVLKHMTKLCNSEPEQAKDGPEEFAKDLLCNHASEAVNTCYPRCANTAARQEGPEQCFGGCVLRMLQHMHMGGDVSLLSGSDLMKLGDLMGTSSPTMATVPPTMATVPPSMATVPSTQIPFPTKEQVLEHINRMCTATVPPATMATVPPHMGTASPTMATVPPSMATVPPYMGTASPTMATVPPSMATVPPASMATVSPHMYTELPTMATVPP